MRAILALASAAVALMPAAAFAQTTTYNDTGAFFGNLNYSPANAAVVSQGGDALFARAKIRYDSSTNLPQAAPASTGNTYQFALGSGILGFDFGLTSSAGFGNLSGTVTITNLGTGAHYSFDAIQLDNTFNGNTLQNSENMNFFPSLGFDQNANDTYQFTYAINGLASGPQTLTINAQFGSGVPEPATWGMMILGFGAIGYAARRRVRRSETAIA